MSKLIVIAIGGNSLLDKDATYSVAEQYKAVEHTCRHIAQLIKEGHKVVITHGNGPQVGYALRRSEIAQKEIASEPLDVCVANTQGTIGYQLQMALSNELGRYNLNTSVATVVTQVVVDSEDPSFNHPSKPIGSYMGEHIALEKQETLGWDIVDDAGRGYRRVVASPHPQKIVELSLIQSLVDQGHVVICCGGGGIPVIQTSDGSYTGIEAVIDKDRTASLLAQHLRADIFLISTAVDKVYLNYNTSNQTSIDAMNVQECQTYIQEGHFAPGSMLPKIEAIIDFIEATHNEAIITSFEVLHQALHHQSGTIITTN